MISASVRVEGVGTILRNFERDYGRVAMEARVRRAFDAAKPKVKTSLGQEMRRAFKIRKPQFADKAWRISIKPMAMTIFSPVRWMGSHTGTTITPRGHAALLIPINTYLGARITTKRFYSIVAWLQQEGLSVIKDGVLYAKPVWNTSRRGGVAAGTRISKQFRKKFQGTLKRPSGFSLSDIRTIDGDRLVPIAVLKRSIRMPARFNIDRLARQRLLPVVIASLKEEFAK